MYGIVIKRRGERRGVRVLVSGATVYGVASRASASRWATREAAEEVAAVIAAGDPGLVLRVARA